MMVMTIIIIAWLPMNNHISNINNTKTTEFILEDNIAKKLNSSILMKKMRNKNLIKYKSFSRAPVSFMYDRLQPTI